MLKKFWNWLLGKITIDDKIMEAVHSVEKTVERVKEETADLVEAVKEVKEQAVDVVEAVQGAPRRGRKPAAKTAAPKTSTRKPKASK